MKKVFRVKTTRNSNAIPSMTANLAYWLQLILSGPVIAEGTHVNIIVEIVPD